MRSEKIEKAKKIIAKKGFWYFGKSYKTYSKCPVCKSDEAESFTFVYYKDKSCDLVCKYCISSYKEALLLTFNFVDFMDEYGIEDSVIEFDVNSYVLKNLYKKYTGKKYEVSA